MSSCFQLVTRPGFIYLRGGIGAGPGGSGRISGAREKKLQSALDGGRVWTKARTCGRPGRLSVVCWRQG